MKDKLKEAFNQVKAEQDLKDKTKTFLLRKTNGYTKRKTVNYRHFVPVAACFLFLLFIGHRLYFTPTVQISIDINPSIELGVNRFNRIVSIEGYNDDGQKLAESLNVKYKYYTEAVDQILNDATITTLLSNEEVMSIGVIGSEGTQSAEILSNIQSCTDGKENTHCYYEHPERMKDAHANGLSYGKYRAFLELQALDPDITTEEIQNMTMREIRDLIQQLSADSEKEVPSDSENGRGHHGTGNRYGK